MASQSAPVAINKSRFYLEYVSIILLTLIGAAWIGDVADSKFVTFAVGFVFYPFLALFYPKHWKNEDVIHGSLGERHRYFYAILALVMMAAALMLLFFPWEDMDRQYQFSLVSGNVVFGAVSILINWRKFQKVSFENE
jgi:accessory gene regulator protein AgrB